jgi:PAS domain S-box-containing protein
MEPMNLSAVDATSDRRRLQYLLAVSPAIIYTTQPSENGYVCTFVSENLQAMLGYSPQEMTTDPKCWPERLHPEDAPRVLGELEPLIKQGGGSVAYRFRHRDGHYVWIQDTFKVVHDESGKPKELVGAWADITELKGARQRLQSLLAVSPAIIYTTQPQGNGYVCTFVSENLQGMLGYSPQEMTTDPKCWPERLHPADAPRVLGELDPLIKKGGGTVAYRFRHRDGYYVWIQDTFKVVHDESGKLRELVGAWADITELRSARQRMEYLLAVSPAIIYTTQPQGNGYVCTFVSENLQGMLGYSPQEMTTDPKCWPERLHPEDAPKVLGELDPLIKKGGGTVSYRFRHRDGQYVWIQDTFKVVNDESGNPQELVGAWVDITERKQAEEAALKANAEIQETKRYLTRVLEGATDAIFSTDKAGNLVLFNQAAELLLGYRPDEVIGQQVSVLYGGEEGVSQIVRELRMRGGTASGFETTLRAKDGTDIPVLLSASVLFDDDDQEIGTVGFASDQRERKQAEQALQNAHDELEQRVDERTTELKAARERLRYVMAVAPGIMYTNKGRDEFKCTFVSENVDPIMGFSTWEMLEDPKFWPSRLHPEDARAVFAEVERLITEGGGTVEYRFRHRNGNYIWIQDTFKVIRDEQGKAVELVGAWADISDRKRAEQALGERLEIMKDLHSLVAASPSVIYTTQVSGDFACTFVSENLQAIMGYAPWEMRDDPKFWVKHLHPEDAERVFGELDRVIGTGAGTVEYRFRHRAGHYLWIQDTFTVEFDKEGKPKELVGSWADISDRKRAEAELDRLAKEVELRNQFIRETFGRYLTEEVVAAVLESPTGLQVGGEKRKVTMMMTDLRGFTSLSERLEPERVVAILNRYLSAMVKVIKEYKGTIDEYIGDAIFVLFGAPVWQEDDAQRAVACAIAMQLAMELVNEQNKEDDLPEIEMGIGLHTGQVVLGNIGSPERMKYGVVGRHVNLTSRIQSYTTGGQILISEATRRELGSILRIGKQLAVQAKGIEHPVTVSEVLGIGGRHKMYLLQTSDVPVPLAEEILIRYAVVEGSHVAGSMLKGRITAISLKQAEVRFEQPVPDFSNINIHVVGFDGKEIPGTLYAKMVGTAAGSTAGYFVSFASMSPEIEAFFRSLLPKSSEPDSSSLSWTTRPSDAKQTQPTAETARKVPDVPQAQPPSGTCDLQVKAPAKPDGELPAMRNAASLVDTSQPIPGERTAQTLRKSPDFSAMSQVQPNPAAAARDSSTDQRSDKTPKADTTPGKLGASAPGGDTLLTSTSGNSQSTTNSKGSTKKKSWLRIF